jgi:hypothetical protein
MNQLLARAKGVLKERWADAILLLVIAAASAWVRLSSVYPLDIGGDPARKWWFVRTWSYANVATNWEHHMTRMAINGFVLPFQKVFGEHGAAYFIPPIVAATVYAILMFFTARRVTGYVGATFAALCAIHFDQMEHAGSQLNPEVFECLYGVLSIYCLFRYQAATERARTGWLLSIGVAMFLLYLTKEPNVFLYPGYALAVWMISRRFRDVAILAAVPLGLFLVETALYAAFTEFEKGRMQIVSSSYSAQEKRPWLRNTTFFGLFRRYVVVKDSWKLALYPFFVLWPTLFFWRRINPHARVLVPIAFSFLFGVTFYIRGINPIQAGTLFHQRYLAPLIPSMFLVLAVVVDAAAGAVLERLPGQKRILNLLQRLRIPLIAVVVGASALIFWLGRSPRKSSGIVLMQEQEALFNRAYAAGLPIVAKRVRSYEYKVPFSIHHIMLSDENLEQPDGTLRTSAYQNVTVGRSRYLYLYKERDADAKIRQLIEDRGCYLEVSARGYTTTIETNRRKIERCLAEAEAKRR